MMKTKIRSPRGGVIFSTGKRNIPLSLAVKEPHVSIWVDICTHECSIMSGHTHYKYVIMLQTYQVFVVRIYLWTTCEYKEYLHQLTPVYIKEYHN